MNAYIYIYGGWKKSHVYTQIVMTAKPCKCYHAIPPNPPSSMLGSEDRFTHFARMCNIFSIRRGVRKRRKQTSNGALSSNFEEGGSGEALSMYVYINLACLLLRALDVQYFPSTVSGGSGVGGWWGGGTLSGEHYPPVGKTTPPLGNITPLWGT